MVPIVRYVTVVMPCVAFLTGLGLFGRACVRRGGGRWGREGVRCVGGQAGERTSGWASGWASDWVGGWASECA